MLQEKAGAIAGQIWEALNGNEGMTQKGLKKATKLRADKDLFLGLGWLLREDKIETSEVEHRQSSGVTTHFFIGTILYNSSTQYIMQYFVLLHCHQTGFFLHKPTSR